MGVRQVAAWNNAVAILKPRDTAPLLATHLVHQTGNARSGLVSRGQRRGHAGSAEPDWRAISGAAALIEPRELDELMMALVEGRPRACGIL